MKIPSVNISPRVQCGKTAGKTRVSVTQLNSKLHCRDFVRMDDLAIVAPQSRLISNPILRVSDCRGNAADSKSHVLYNIKSLVKKSLVSLVDNFNIPYVRV